MGVRETTTTESLEQATVTKVEFSSILKSEVTGFSVYRLTPCPEITYVHFFPAVDLFLPTNWFVYGTLSLNRLTFRRLLTI